MSLEDLYSEIILDYAKNKKYKKKINDAIEEHGKNLSCGDEINLYVIEKDGLVHDISFEGHGCIISQASASMMCELIKGKEVNLAKSILDNVLKMSRGEEYDKSLIEDLEIFEDISTYPMRVKCFTLSWHTLDEIIGK